jgi:hypothetical protein
MRMCTESWLTQIEIAPALRGSESLGYVLKAENADHAKVHMISPYDEKREGMQHTGDHWNADGTDHT